MALPAPPPGFLALTLVRREDVTDDLMVVRLRAPEPLPFLPGQYVTLALPTREGRPVKRAYSIVSAPHESEIELVVELVEHGELTPLLWPVAEGGVVWGRRKIVGHFLLDPAHTRHVMACTVTGIAPFMSMIRAHRHARATGVDVPENRFLVLFGASRSVEHGPYRAELEAVAREGWLDSVPTVSRAWLDGGWAGEKGRVEDVLRKHLDRLGWDGPDTAGYACGNPDMIENVKGLLVRAGLLPDHVHEEKYFTHHDDPEPAAPEAAAPASPRAPGGITLKAVPREGT